MAWYQLTEGADQITIEFAIPDNREFDYSEIKNDPLPGHLLYKRNVEITGKGSLWMYAHAVMTCYSARASGISIFNARHQTKTAIYPLNVADSQFDAPILIAEQAGSDMFITVRERERAWESADLGAVIKAFSQFKDDLRYIISCKGPNWLLAFIVILCEIKRAKRIEYFDARKHMCLDLKTLQSRTWALPDYLKRKKIAVGIVGDPNSGKSVFSSILQASLATRHMVTWLLDSDMASPTPPWYLASINRGDVQIAKKARSDRDNQKRPWNHKMELAMASSILNFKKFQDILIVDLPGGKHLPGEAAIRIPEGREVMFANLDFIIIIGKQDKPEAEQGWRHELMRIGANAKICAVLTSSEPELDFDLARLEYSDDILTGTVTGLNRDTLAATIKENGKVPKLNGITDHILEKMQERNMQTIMTAMDFAARKHVFQKRRDGQTPYINHPIDVARFLTNEANIQDITVIAAALLHDTLEDTATSYDELKTLLGVAIADVVKEVTDDRSLPKGERKEMQIEHAANYSISAQYVKFADSVCNMRSMLHAPPNWDTKRKVAYIHWVKTVVEAMAHIPGDLKDCFASEYAKAVAIHGTDAGGFSYDHQVD